MVLFDKFTLKANTWYAISCTKLSDKVRITVDARSTDEPSAVTNISNSEPVTLGGKPECGVTPDPNQPDVQCDYFRGDMDRAAITRG